MTVSHLLKELNMLGVSNPYKYHIKYDSIKYIIFLQYMLYYIMSKQYAINTYQKCL